MGLELVTEYGKFNACKYIFKQKFVKLLLFLFDPSVTRVARLVGFALE